MSEANGDLRAFGRELADTVNPMWLLRTLPEQRAVPRRHHATG